jgi:protein TonB
MIRVSSGVIAAQAVYQPQPVYPPIAIAAHVQGTVVLEAIIGRDGTVQDLKILKGHPLLVRAALDAVRTWRYQPTMLDSEPVDVLTEINVKFTLSQ